MPPFFVPKCQGSTLRCPVLYLISSKSKTAYPLSDGPGSRKRRREFSAKEAQALYGEMTASASTDVDTKVHFEVLQGYPTMRISAVAALLGLHPDAMAKRRGLSRTTFKRKLSKAGSKLDPVASDVLARHEHLFQAALAAFWDDPDYARTWLRTAQQGLDWVVPLEYARSSAGATALEPLMGQISRGSYVQDERLAHRRDGVDGAIAAGGRRCAGRWPLEFPWRQGRVRQRKSGDGRSREVRQSPHAVAGQSRVFALLV